MDFLSEKVKNLTPYVAGTQPLGENWIKLNTNENPYPPSPKVMEALQNADIAKLRLYPDSDSRELCRAIANQLNVSPENIFCGNSSDEVLALAFQAFYSGKTNILTPDISYGFYPVWGEMYSVGFNVQPLREDFSVNIADYKNSKGVIIANPNAPTSLALSLPEIEQILHQNPDGLVLADEAYIDFARFESAVPLIKTHENLLVVRTFSKSYSLAGLRVGFAVGNPALIEGLKRVRDSFNSYPLDMLAQLGATAAIQDSKSLAKTTKRVIATRETAIARLNELGYRVLPSQANFLFMEAENAPALYQHLLGNKILVRHWNKPRINNFLRVSVGTEQEMEAFIQCVKQQ